MSSSSSRDFELVKREQLDTALPREWAKHRLGAVMLVSQLPSVNEVQRAGKKVAAFREAVRSLPASFAVERPSEVYRFPGSRLHALVSFSKKLPSEIRTYGDLLHVPIGRWFDLQIVDRDRVVAFTIRENDELLVVSPSFRFSVEEAYGERLPLSNELLKYLRA